MVYASGATIGRGFRDLGFPVVGLGLTRTGYSDNLTDFSAASERPAAKRTLSRSHGCAPISVIQNACEIRCPIKPTTRFKAACDFAVQIAREAGDLTLRYFRSSGLQVDRKADDSPVTAADRRCRGIAPGSNHDRVSGRRHSRRGIRVRSRFVRLINGCSIRSTERSRLSTACRCIRR